MAGPGHQETKIRSRSGVNIFDLPLGRPENSFAADSPRPGITDVYLICLAHELAHNMLDTVGRKQRPDLYERKFSGLAQAAGPHVVYRSPASKGIDLEATKAIFRRLGAWDGRAESWRDAWVDYFADKREFDRAYSRGNIQFFLDSPQEAFATLANQYYADSALMLEFCKKRWDTGHRTNINQFLLIAEYLSEGKDDGKFFQLLPGGKLSVNEVQFARDARMRIQRVRFSDMQAEFDYGDDALVTKFELNRGKRKSDSKSSDDMKTHNVSDFRDFACCFRLILLINANVPFFHSPGMGSASSWLTQPAGLPDTAVVKVSGTGKPQLQSLCGN